MSQDKKTELDSEQNENTGKESSPDYATLPRESAIRDAKQTELLELPEDFEPKPMPQRSPTTNTTRLTSGWRIVFRIADQKIVLNIEDQIVVGRKIDEESNDIDMDLTPFGAYHFGVSRKHAVMMLDDGYLYLEDLGSTNGTRINGFQLTSNQRYRLRDGDEIEFARMRTSIRFSNEE